MTVAVRTIRLLCSEFYVDACLTEVEAAGWPQLTRRTAQASGLATRRTIRSSKRCSPSRQSTSFLELGMNDLRAVLDAAESERLDRYLASVLFTDIVGSTTHASTLGDRSLGGAAVSSSRHRARDAHSVPRRGGGHRG
jgi:class 3 adenylate cyclase